MTQAAVLAARVLIGIGVSREDTINSISAEFPAIARARVERVVDYAASQLERERRGHAAIGAEHDLDQSMHGEGE